ncbi:MAG: class I SAM-dependent methyltransferase [Thermoanaerobaculia bacterium]
MTSRLGHLFRQARRTIRQRGISATLKGGPRYLARYLRAQRARRKMEKILIEVPLLYDSWTSLIPPRDLWVGAADPLVQFVRWPLEYRNYLPLLCGMRRDSSVLELGCHHGRTMLGLVDYLRPPGRYEGLDIMPRQIEFAQRHIHKAFPNFNFTLADVHSQTYNPEGRISAETYRFPYPDASFDVIYAASLFTHLLPQATANYLRESRRVLHPGGRCLFSFLVLENYRNKGPEAWFELRYPLQGFDRVAIRDPENPESLIAYETSFVEEMATKAGLKLERVIPGFWSDRHDLTVNEHDLFLLEAV